MADKRMVAVKGKELTQHCRRPPICDGGGRSSQPLLLISIQLYAAL